MKKRRLRKKTKRVLKIIGAAIAVLVLIAAAVVLSILMKNRGKTAAANSAGRTVEVTDADQVLTYNGNDYVYNSGLENILVLGIDHMEENGEITADTEDLCDFLLLVSIDTVTGESTVVQLNRDTMVTMPTPFNDGTDGGDAYQQLAYAHYYGGTQERKCKNVAATVSALLGDIPIDHYISIAMGGIPELVDMIGGVSVTITSDFSEASSELSQYAAGDTVDMDGELALEYVRTRHNVEGGTNDMRMLRQQSLMSALAEELRAAYEQDNSFAQRAYTALADYMTTDCTAEELAQIAGQLDAADTDGILIPEGHNELGEDNLVEYYLNEEDLQELIVNCYYLPVG